MGSCFADTLGEYAHRWGMKCLTNPFGNVYNPVSLLHTTQEPNTEHFIQSSDGLWYSLDFHSDVFAYSKDALLQYILEVQQRTITFLQNASLVVLTLGTAWVYRYVHSQRIVSNCHKLPQVHFEKSILTVEDCQTALLRYIEYLRSVNPKIQFIFTVSPVRHIKDGLTENAWSKSTLICAVHELVQSQSKLAQYFPSYEIMVDELRDYRYYAKDLIHPTEEAKEYICNAFLQYAFNEESSLLAQKHAQLYQSCMHRPTHTHTKSHKNWKVWLSSEIQKLALAMDTSTLETLYKNLQEHER